jgi:hypothetical protein
MSTKAKCLNQAYAGNPHKEYGGYLTMTSLQDLMGEKKIGMKTITEDFQEMFRAGQDAFDILYLVQCEVSRMQKKIQYKNIDQDNQAPIPYWCSSKIANKPSYDWFF